MQVLPKSCEALTQKQYAHEQFLSKSCHGYMLKQSDTRNTGHTAAGTLTKPDLACICSVVLAAQCKCVQSLLHRSALQEPWRNKVPSQRRGAML